GGATPYTYSWSTLETTTSITGFATGNYTVTVTDLNSCSTIATASVGVSPPVPSLDQSNTGTYSGWNTNNTYLAQSFTATKTGFLNRVDINVWSGSAGGTLEIYDGADVCGNLLYSASVNY